MIVDLLYIDRNVCTRCQGAEQALDDAVAEASPVLASLGVSLSVNKVLVDSAEMAQRLRLVSSPTIRIDGTDIQPVVEEDDCASCGTLVKAGGVDCRVWGWRGERFTSPPKGLILEALLRAALDPLPVAGDQQPFHLPENLSRFFQARQASCSSGCC